MVAHLTRSSPIAPAAACPVQAEWLHSRALPCRYTASWRVLPIAVANQSCGRRQKDCGPCPSPTGNVGMVARFCVARSKPERIALLHFVCGSGHHSLCGSFTNGIWRNRIRPGDITRNLAVSSAVWLMKTSHFGSTRRQSASIWDLSGSG